MAPGRSRDFRRLGPLHRYEAALSGQFPSPTGFAQKNLGKPEVHGRKPYPVNTRYGGGVGYGRQEN